MVSDTVLKWTAHPASPPSSVAVVTFLPWLALN